MEANRNAKNISVFMIKKNGTKQMIGQINQTTTTDIHHRFNTSNVVKTSIEQVNDFNMYILDYIKKDIIHPLGFNLASFQTFNVFFIDDIIGIIFKKIHVRNGNIYFVFQKSRKGIRFLCYIVPYENHTSIALGSELIYTIQDAKKGISEELPELLEKLGKFGSIYPYFQNSAAKFNVNKNFGID